MDFEKIEQKIAQLSPYVKEIKLIMHNSAPFALIYPDFEKLKKAHIINIYEELHWYAVELYNLEAKENEKIKGFLIVPYSFKTTTKDYHALLKTLQTKHHDNSDEPKDDTYLALKHFIASLCHCEVFFTAHLELDLGLDSLSYVELFAFVEESFGVFIDEAIFSQMMNLNTLYEYVKKHKKYFKPSKITWKELLKENVEQKLIYSPYIMYTYKTLLLPLFKLYFRLEIKGRQNIPDTPCIFAPSHQSMLDGFLVEASLPYSVLKHSFFLAYKQVFGTSVLEPIAKHGQTILIDANENLLHSMLLCAQVLKEKNSLVIFPEGARTRDRQLLPFKPFFAMLSKEYNIPVIPVMIDGSFEALPSGKLFPKPKKIKLSYLKPIYPGDLSYEQIAQKTKDAIATELEHNSVLR